MKKAIDLSGQKFGMLTARKRVSEYGTVPVRWMCVCDCGNECVRPSQHLRIGRAFSCGCSRQPRKATSETKQGNKMVTYFGQTKPLADWCSTLGLPYQKTYARLQRGWDPKSAFENKNPYQS